MTKLEILLSLYPILRVELGYCKTSFLFQDQQCVNLETHTIRQKSVVPIRNLETIYV